MTKRTIFAVWVATIAMAALAASSAQAKFVLTLRQNGSDVLGEGSGSLDLTNFGPSTGTARLPTEIAPNGSVISAGSSEALGPDVSFFNGSIVAPSNFGPGGQTLGESVGDPVFVGTLTIGVPIGYVFGAPLSNSSFYIGASLDSLGVNPGSYVWSWGTGAHADTFTLDILAIGSPAVPEASTWAMALIGFVGLGCVAARRKAAIPKSPA
jgi:hypothetical protein